MQNSWRKDLQLLEAYKRGINFPRFISINLDNEIEVNMSNIEEQETIEETLRKFILSTPYKKVNIRLFSKDSKSNDFHLGLKVTDIGKIKEIVKESTSKGLMVMINEYIEPEDSGVSGVILGNYVEFAENTTPRVVESGGVTKLPLRVFEHYMKLIYNIDIKEIPIDTHDKRIEFSIHPNKVGYLNKSYTVWEISKVKTDCPVKRIKTPSPYSDYLGEKLFGLILADALGYNVPKTEVTHVELTTFSFGTPTGSDSKWTRTVPMRKQAGKYETVPVQINPIVFLDDSNIKGHNLTSILVQEGVNPEYSGSLITNERNYVVSGVKGPGDDFMLGRKKPEELPEHILEDVLEVRRDIIANYHGMIGEYQIEWVHDGEKVWIVQFNLLEDVTIDPVHIVRGEVESWVHYPVSRGLEPLREMVKSINRDTTGVILFGEVGITSHFGDILRQKRIVSKISK